MNAAAGHAVRRALPIRHALVAFLLLAMAAPGALAQLDFTNARRDVAVNSTPRALATGDLNGDSRPDLVVASSSADAVSILLGVGGGVFGPAATVATGFYPDAVVLADFNGDSHLDMAVACFVSDEFEIFLGNGAGGFGLPTSYSTGPGSRPKALAVVKNDLSIPQQNDLVVALYGTNEVQLWYGNGSGGFSLAQTLTGLALGPVALAVGDWDGDGRIYDIAVVSEGDTSLNPPGNGTVTVYYGSVSCPGQYCFPAPIAVGPAPESVTWGLLNNDAIPDLVVGSIAGTDLSILYGDPDFGFTFVAPLAVGGGSYTASVGDYNGDTKQDIAVGMEIGGTAIPAVRLYTGNGFGTFTLAGTFPVGAAPSAMLSLDFAGSSSPDLVTADTTASALSLLVSDGAGGFSATPRYAFPAGSILSSIHSADMNADGKIDLAVSRNDVNQLDLIQGSGLGTFSAWQSLILPGNQPGDAQAGSILFDNFTSDSNRDLAVVVGGNDAIAVFPGNGAGAFGARVDYSLGTGCNFSTGVGCLEPQSMVAGPLNDTDATHPDIVVSLLGGDASFPYGSISVLLQAGGGFGAATRYTGGSNPICVGSATPGAACTANSDCKGKCSGSVTQCLVSTDCPSGQTCTAPGPGTCTISPTGVAVDLLNGDVNSDLMVCGSDNTREMFLPGSGTGAFTTVGSSATAGIDPQWPILRDLDGDGSLDLAVVSGFDSIVSTFLGDGAGNFTPLAQTGGGPHPTRGVMADFNLDGWDDLAVNNTTSGSVSILLGDGTGHFGKPVRLGVGFGPISLNTADYNGDGAPDIACSDQQDGTVSFLLNASHVPQISLDHAAGTTSVTWPGMFEAASYDVIRGTIGQISQAGATADLGAVTCVEDGSPDTLATETGVTPPFGTVYFYLMRNKDSNVKGSYGRTGAGKIRVPSSGDCL